MLLQVENRQLWYRALSSMLLRHGDCTCAVAANCPQIETALLCGDAGVSSPTGDDGRARKVARRPPDYLRAHEVQPLLAALNPKWQPLFATALNAGSSSSWCCFDLIFICDVTSMMPGMTAGTSI
jgi:hypothetical protein